MGEINMEDGETALMELYHEYRLQGLSPKDAMDKAKATIECFWKKKDGEKI